MTTYDYYPATAVNGFTTFYGGTVVLNNCIAFTFSGGYEAVGVSPTNPPLAGNTISYEVWSPGPATIAPLIQNSAFNFVFANAVSLVAGWNNVSYVVPAGNTVLAIGFQANAYTGTLLLNNVTWGATTAANTITVTNPGAQTATIGTAVSLQLAASDSASGQTLTYTAADLPAGLSASSAGLISGTPTTAQTVAVTVTVTDGTGASGSATFNYIVNAAAVDTITITNPGAQTLTAGTAYNLQIHATDSESKALSFTASGLPAGLSISSSGDISGTPTTSSNTVTVTATDGAATSTTQFNMVVNAANTPPPPPPTGFTYTTSANTGTLPPSGSFDSAFPTIPNVAAYVIPNVWNPTSAVTSQVLSANSPSDWQVVANFASGNTAVLSYPDSQVTMTNTNDQPTLFTTFSSLVSTFGHEMPSDNGTQGPGDDYEAAYDIWLGSGSNNYAQEVMVWEDTHNQVPAGNDTGKTYTDANGVVYEIWTASGNNPVTFLRKNNVTSGSLDLLALFNFMKANGYTTNNGVNQIDYGFELCSTSGKAETFTVNNFTLVANQPSTAPSTTSTTSGALDGGFSVGAVGGYNLQVNEYNSSATLDLNWSNPPAAFTVMSSAVSVATNGEPAAYPSLYLGNHWGTISPSNPFPLQVSAITAGEVTTTIAGAVPTAGAWDYAYDIWFVPTATGNQNGTKLEMMIWLNHLGGVQPAGSQITTTTIGGIMYNVWWSTGGTVTFQIANPVTSVTNLDLFPLIQYAVTQGWLNSSWFLIDVEAGFELWQNGTGLKITDFSVTA